MGLKEIFEEEAGHPKRADGDAHRWAADPVRGCPQLEIAAEDS
jgi:hypothetical protein